MAVSDVDPAAHVQRLQAEIAAEAEVLRRRDPALERLERDIARSWETITPPGATGDADELLMDRTEQLAMVDVDVPVGDRRGVREVKAAIRKGTYWYHRYLADQLNAFHHVQARLLRRLDARLGRLERLAGSDEQRIQLADPVAAPSAEIAASVIAHLAGSTGSIAVLGEGGIEIQRALAAAGHQVHSVDQRIEAVLEGVGEGLDARSGDPVEHLAHVEGDALAGLVLGPFVETRSAAELVDLAACAQAKIGPGGTIVVVAADPSFRSIADRELLAGLGFAPSTWRQVLERSGLDVGGTVPEASDADHAVVVARRP